MNELTFQTNGREVKFSNVPNAIMTGILKDYFFSGRLPTGTETVSRTPIDGRWFEVFPTSINQDLFKKKRKDDCQEETRRYIKAAFAEMSKYPWKYSNPFRTMMPEKTWSCNFTEIEEIERQADKFGGYMANWVEQALEWAQRINNGEDWEYVCNSPDTACWFRLVVWKDCHVRIIGGSVLCQDKHSATTVWGDDRMARSMLDLVVPLVVKK